MPSPSEIQDKRIFFLDLDGVLRVGKEETKLIGGKKLISKLGSTGRDFRILSNTTTATAEDLSIGLEPIGLEIPPEKILTASHLTAKYLKDNFGPSSCYLIGEEPFAEELRSFGHEVFDLNASLEPERQLHASNEGKSFVVVGLDRNLNFRELNHAMVRVRDLGARIIASHVARTYYDSEGPTISVGPIVTALEYATKKKMLASVGKPSRLMFEIALDDCCRTAKDALMVGDQLEVDIAGANSLGIYSVLVLTGVDKRESIGPEAPEPSCIVNNVDELAEFL